MVHKVIILLLIAYHALCKPFFMDNEWYDPSHAPNASVVFGKARFSILTDTLVRMECSRTTSFDDRPSFIVLNRNLPVPKYNVKHIGSNTLQIETSKVTVRYNKEHSKQSSCSNAQTNTDQMGGSRIKKHPDGIAVKDQGACCRTCDDEHDCAAWVFANNEHSPSINCWLMNAGSVARPAKDRVFGKKSAFCEGQLSVTFTNNGKQVTWTPETPPTGNLNGTIDAADCYVTPKYCIETDYAQRMQKGLLSKDGWSLVEDTTKYKFTSVPHNEKEEGYPWYEEKQINSQDWYFFAYGRDYLGLINDYKTIAGKITMPPHNAFGVWWSRYWPYSEKEFLQDVIQGYADNGLPLNVAVLDMDWHIEPKEHGCETWGGFTWNETLFPDPVSFMNHLKSDKNPTGHPLQISLNVHPQTGVDHCQDRYAEIAKVMGIDPKSKKAVECNMGNRTFVEYLYKIYYDAEKLAPVDYWWTDYAGKGGPGGYELLWSNYVYDSHLQQKRNKRPLVLSRYGGLGNHRLPIGFSGDTFQSFSTLKWEIQMTQTASNVLFGYWSHDIGGFHAGKDCPGDADPTNRTGSELLLRWLQFGAVSPIFRTHCDHCERRIWKFPYFDLMKDAMLLRNALVPYIYSMARIAYETGVSLIRPMYYTHPNEERAYQATDQYWYGDSILAAPISAPVDASGTTKWPVWLPSGGNYMSWDGTKAYIGNSTASLDLYDRSQIPLFVKEGHVIPMRCMKSVAKVIADPLSWVMHLSGSGKGELYEDDGSSLNYKTGEFAKTVLTYKYNGRTALNVLIKVPTGPYAKSLPADRAHVLQIRTLLPATLVASVTCNEQRVPPGRGAIGYYTNDQNSLAVTKGALIVNLPRVSRDTDIQVEIVF